MIFDDLVFYCYQQSSAGQCAGEVDADNAAFSELL